MASSKVDIWMPIYIGDYLRDTQNLTAEEHGVYFLLLMYYWQKRGNIGSDIKRLAIVAKSTPETTGYILDMFFELSDGNYCNKRADKELGDAQARSDSARANVNKRWSKDTDVIPPYNGSNTGDDTELIRNGYSSSSSSSSESSSPSKKEEYVLPKESGSKRIESARLAWNDRAPAIGPTCRLMAITFKPEDTSDCLRVMNAYSDAEIIEAMDNYCKIRDSQDHEVKAPYQSFVGFIRGGVEKFISESDPWTAYKRRLTFDEMQEAENRRNMIAAGLIPEEA